MANARSKSRIVHWLTVVAGVPVVWLVAPTVEAQSPRASGGCVEVAPAAKPPTKTEKGPDSGTKNMGSTGWSGGGMGGSHNDTTQAGPAPGAGTEHPATAQGLDPTKPSTKPPPC
jgi:hypothetical protein